MLHVRCKMSSPMSIWPRTCNRFDHFLLCLRFLKIRSIKYGYRGATDSSTALHFHISSSGKLSVLHDSKKWPPHVASRVRTDVRTNVYPILIRCGGMDFHILRVNRRIQLIKFHKLVEWSLLQQGFVLPGGVPCSGQTGSRYRTRIVLPNHAKFIYRYI